MTCTSVVDSPEVGARARELRRGSPPEERVPACLRPGACDRPIECAGRERCPLGYGI